MDIGDIQKRIGKDIEIDKNNLTEAVRMHPAVHHRYLTLLQEEELKLSKIKEAQRNSYSELFHHFRWESKLKSKNKAEIDAQINRDENYRKLRDLFRKQENFVNYLQRVVDIFRERGFALKNLIDLRKLENEYD